MNSDLKLDMDLQLQGVESPGVLQFFPTSLPLGTMSMRFLLTSQKAYFISVFVCLQSFAIMFTYKRTGMVKLPGLSC